MADTIKREGPKTELVNMLRWEEDGGTIIENQDLATDRQFVRPVPLNRGMYNTSLKWNEKFVIEPFQTGSRIDLIKKKVSTNRASK